jgi:hypothetical protein
MITLESYLTNKHEPAKLARLERLPDVDTILEHVVEVLGKAPDEGVLQDIGTRLGRSLGYRDQIEAFRTGAEILSVVSEAYDNMLDIDIDDREIYVTPLVEATPELSYETKPSFVPRRWKRNRNLKGDSVIKGWRNHHDRRQDLSSLNIIQAVEMEIDIDVWFERDQFISETYLEFKDRMDEVFEEYRGKGFFFEWDFDKRGRFYIKGWVLNLQSDEEHRAMLSLRNHVLNTDLRNLKIAVAGHAGKDKLTWDERVAWFDSNPELIQTKFSMKDMTPEEIDDSGVEYFMGRKALRAFRKAEAYEASGYMMNVDATASVLQIMAVLLGCKETAIKCNLINTGRREDPYTSLLEFLNVDIDRDSLKEATMTHLYNSTNKPAEIFGADTDELDLFYEAVEKLFPGATDALITINAHWDYDADFHSWTLPDGHVAYVPVTETVDQKFVIDELDDGVEVVYRYEVQQPSERSSSLAPNIIHSVDGYVAREMVKRTPFDLLCIHDSFWFAPDNLQVVQQTYREILAEISQSNLLANILSEISRKPLRVEKFSYDLHKDILQSEYALS